MKLRIRDNSLRLRLTKSEVARIGAGEVVESKIFFSPGSSLLYALDPCGAEKIEARYSENRVHVLVPHAQAYDWATGETVALTASQDIGDGGVLSILVEKDFRCLKPRQHEHEDESDLFLNPNPTCG